MLFRSLTQNAERIAVFDRSAGLGAMGGPLFQETVSAVGGGCIVKDYIGGAAAAEISYDTQTYDAQSDDPEESGKPAVESGPAGRTVKESVITMEIECPDPKGVMTFADEIYREQKSVLVSFMDVEAVYESGEDGQETYQGMKGIVEVRYYYEEIG